MSVLKENEILYRLSLWCNGEKIIDSYIVDFDAIYSILIAIRTLMTYAESRPNISLEIHYITYPKTNEEEEKKE